MSNIAFTRIQRECKEVVTNKEIAETGIMIEILNDSLSEIKGQIRGPPDTPYQGGSFDLEIKPPDPSPFTPPKGCVVNAANSTSEHTSAYVFT
ncbi:ubiquitin--protein ligase [Teladorsagia circumcincta]|uniref:Ubiquitin--protein ligase n=1 Tax=Teladorsagia circumcincta TaxID=45464 RepID=A0A2G9UPV4_TELCI|nr:ubiquitin--protein ligase [Teladorsagia circumcincta]